MTSTRIRGLIVGVVILCGCSGGNDTLIEASGTIEGTDINIATEVAGRVREARAEEGFSVSRGDTLAVIDDTEYRLQLRQAEASRQALESAYRLAVEGARREDIIQAEAAYRTADADYKRMKGLLATQTVTQKQYDDAYSRFVGAEQTYQKLLAGSRREEILGAKARSESAAAQVELLRKKVRDCAVLSPASGVVTLRGIEPGEFVATGTNMYRVTHLEKVKMTIYLNEVEVGRIKLGQAASVTIDAAPDRRFDGRIVFISPVAEFTPKNVQTREERTKLVFAVRLEVTNPNGALKPGLPADATIVL